jgi:drug/metabolite transporter (DMT)-like permease
MHEPFGWPQVVGMAAVIAGTIIIQKPERVAE